MSLRQLLIAVFALLIVGLCLPLSYGARMALFLALTALGALTVAGGGVHYVLRVFS